MHDTRDADAARETARRPSGRFGDQQHSAPEVEIAPDDEHREDLLASVRDWRDPRTTPSEAETIRSWWASHGIPNQFAAAARAHALGKRAARPAKEPSS